MTPPASRAEPGRRPLAGAGAAALLISALLALSGCGDDDPSGGGGGDTTVTLGGGASADERGERKGRPTVETAEERAAERLPGECPNEDLDATQADLATVERAVFCLLNEVRRDRGLSPLTRHRALAEAATAHSLDMDERDYFAHVSPGGGGLRDWVRGTGYVPARGGWRLGENIGWGGRGSSSPVELMAGWMDSPSHRENIVAPDFDHVGIAVTRGTPDPEAEPGAIYTTIFGAQSNPG